MVQHTIPIIEQQAAIFQATLTAGLAALFSLLYRRYRRPYLGWWALTWIVFTLRLGCIITFLANHDDVWLYIHQVLTGGTALALFASAYTFERGQPVSRHAWWLALLPPAVAYIT